jgi:hypothetical protein
LFVSKITVTRLQWNGTRSIEFQLIPKQGRRATCESLTKVVKTIFMQGIGLFASLFRMQLKPPYSEQPKLNAITFHMQYSIVKLNP